MARPRALYLRIKLWCQMMADNAHVRDKLRPMVGWVNSGISTIVEWLLSAGETSCGSLEKSVSDGDPQC